MIELYIFCYDAVQLQSRLKIEFFIEYALYE